MAQFSHVALVSAGIGPPVMLRNHPAYRGGRAASGIMPILCYLDSPSLPEIFVHLVGGFVRNFGLIDGHVLSSFKNLGRLVDLAEPFCWIGGLVHLDRLIGVNH